MDQFLVLTTVSDKVLTDRICTELEHKGIPVLLEHVELIEGQTVASRIRILVPSRFVNAASKLLNLPISASNRNRSEYMERGL